ncbi:MAG: glycosyltransferase, partial [Acidobacteriota bacterium]|nr:glycosyltransferase [Acidobacteriota bacterium]
MRLLCVATVNAGKGHDLLLEALAAVPSHQWHLTCAGSLTRDAATADRVRGLVRQFKLEDRVTLAGELDAEAIVACYDAADVFVLATRRETYGMAVAEALARGLPVVSTTTGAIPDLVGADAGVLVPPGEVAALAEALSRVISDADLRARLTAGAREVRDRLQTWEVATARMDAALQRLDAHVETLGDWLKLREAADWEARSSRLVEEVVAAAPPEEAPYASGTSYNVLDLGTGTGSNVRYLADRLPGRQRWLVVDRSPDLLALVTDRTASWATARGYNCRADATGLHVRHEALDCEIETRQRDLRVLDDRGLF